MPQRTSTPSRHLARLERAAIARRLGRNLHRMSEESEEGERWLGNFASNLVWHSVHAAVMGGAAAWALGYTPTVGPWFGIAALALGARVLWRWVRDRRHRTGR